LFLNKDLDLPAFLWHLGKELESSSTAFKSMILRICGREKNLINQAPTHQLSSQVRRKKGHAQIKPQVGCENHLYSGVHERELIKHTAGSSLLWEEGPRVSKGRSSDLSFAFWSNLSSSLSGRSLFFHLPKLGIAPRSALHLLYFIACLTERSCDTEG